MVKLLLQKGANKDIRNRVGKTAYEVAAEYGQNRLFDALRLGDSLCVAARKGEVRTIQKLVENGAAINGRDQHGWTALHRASFKGKVDAVRALMEKGIDIDAKDEDGYTALHCAVEAGQTDVIEMLVKKGADVEAQTNKGVTLLQIAESLHYIGITRILIHGGATKDNMIVLPAPGDHGPGPFGDKKIAAKEAVVGDVKKKKPNRARALRSSFDLSLPLAVLEQVENV
jgi:ankyrin repeat protein